MIDIGSRMWAVEPVFARAINGLLASGKEDRIVNEIRLGQLARKEMGFIGMNAAPPAPDGGANADASDLSSQPLAGESLRQAQGDNGGTAEQYVAVIPIMGGMTRYGDACSYGTETLGRWMKQCERDERIVGVLLEIDSPGGEVNGTQQLGEIVRDLKKPVVSFVKGMGASAAYWVASQSKKIFMEAGPVSSVGSIGVLMVHYEFKSFEEQNGVKFTLLRSDGSSNKAKLNPYEVLTDEVAAEVRAEMNAMRADFVKVVKAGRKGKLNMENAEQIFSGKMFRGKEAINEGLADAFGTMEDAAKEVFRLAK
ncbi:S49 family peptidase [Lacihabitans soyangensis]|uniref:S49 family peptidase n=1 Tax=Lacihabitans soyangensis TaxID=869394 RepID=A0AAE3KX04_9BACT|nr:S49 family peptidase [Lacihabitans soyangensis]MCP9763810.1 S49 family peptidase [Lacihabitans soyangensis]